MINDPHARAAEICSRIPQGGTFLEIGVWRGANAARVLKRRPDVKAVLVDPWAPAKGSYATSGSSDSRLDLAGWEETFRVAQRNLGPYMARTSIVRMRAEDFLPLRVHDTYDVIFIDGDHSYEGAASDIALFTPVAKVWIGGHDYAKQSFPGVKVAVDEVFGDKVQLGADSTWWVRK